MTPLYVGFRVAMLTAFEAPLEARLVNAFMIAAPGLAPRPPPIVAAIAGREMMMNAPMAKNIASSIRILSSPDTAASPDRLLRQDVPHVVSFRPSARW